MSDSSITAQQKLNGRKISAGREYQTEMVSPICRYEDIVTIQEKSSESWKEYGAPTNGSCGIHVHINGNCLMPEPPKYYQYHGIQGRSDL